MIWATRLCYDLRFLASAGFHVLREVWVSVGDRVPSENGDDAHRRSAPSEAAIGGRCPGETCLTDQSVPIDTQSFGK